MHIFFAIKKLERMMIFFVCLAHNIFGFDFYFIMRGIMLPVYKSNDSQVGSSNLVNINFTRLSSQIKFFDTLNDYQESLAAILSTATVESTILIEKATSQFLCSMNLSNRIYQNLVKEIQGKVLDLIVPYENIKTSDSLNSTPIFFFLPRVNFIAN